MLVWARSSNWVLGAGRVEAGQVFEWPGSEDELAAALRPRVAADPQGAVSRFVPREARPVAFCSVCSKNFLTSKARDGHSARSHPPQSSAERAT